MRLFGSRYATLRAAHRPVTATAESLESRRFLSFATSFPVPPTLSQRSDVNTSPFIPGNELFPGNQANEGESLIVINPANPREVVALAVDLDANGIVTADKVWRSSDGGLSYGPPSIVPLPAGHFARGDPAAAFDRAGNLYYVHLTSTFGPNESSTHVAIAKWPNGAATWSHATTVDEEAFLGIDKPWITVGPKPGMLGEDIVYVLYNGQGGTHCARSLDGGTSFQDDVLIPGGAFPHVAASWKPEDNGRLYAVYEKQLPGFPVDTEIRLTYSTDGGVTWPAQNDQRVGTTPVDRAEWSTQNFLPSPHGIHPVPSVAVSSTGLYAGRVFVSYTSVAPGHVVPDSDITVAWSDNPTTGQNWNPVIVHSTSDISLGKSQFFPWVSTDRMTGVPYVSWMDCRNDSANIKVERFGTASVTGGQSWLSEIKIADGQSDQSDVQANPFSYGDYIANSAFGGMSYDAWPDNSNSTGNNVNGTNAADIYTDRVILEGHVITVTSTSEDNIYHVQLDDDDNPQFVCIWENTAPTGTPTFMIHKDALEGLVFDLGDGIDVVFVTPKVIDYLSASGGFIDLGESRMIVDYPESSPLAMIQALITSGYHGGNWDGSGIRSSAAASVGNTGIGFAEATDLFTTFPAVFSGQEVDDTTVLLRYTGYGDTDLNGNVNLDDFNRLAGNYGQSNRRWPHGDFNYNTLVNLDDFNLLAANYGMMFGDDAEDPGNGFVEYTYEDLLEMLLGGG